MAEGAEGSLDGGELAAEELAAVRRRLLNVVGHELRTPAGMIQGLAEEVCNAEDLQQVTQVIGPALLRNATRLNALLDELLVAAGIQTAIPVGRLLAVPLTPLLHATWAQHADGALALTGDDVVLHADPALVGRVVEAVLENAAAYGTAAPEVRVAQADGAVRVAVRSPGPPLHPEEIRLATEAFFRGERAVTSRPGLGLGLAVARELLAHVGGALAFTGDDEGTTTTVEMPLDHRPGPRS